MTEEGTIETEEPWRGGALDFGAEGPKDPTRPVIEKKFWCPGL